MHHEKSSGDPLALGNIHPMALYINLKNEKRSMDSYCECHIQLL